MKQFRSTALFCALGLSLAIAPSIARAAEPTLNAEETRGSASDAQRHFGDSPDNPGPIADLDSSLKSDAIKKVETLVADWQLKQAQPYFNQQWTFGALYGGFLAASQTTGDLRWHDAMIAMGERFKWDITRPGSGRPGDLLAGNPTTRGTGVRRQFPINANSEAMAQAYIELYFEYKNPWMIDNTRQALDDQIPIETYPAARGGGRGGDQGSASATNPNHIIWWWCDALYMAPPAWTRMYKATGDKKYLDAMDHQWWITSDNLYDPQEHLYYRDETFKTKKESNGTKMFWSRGEGWVMGGLARVLQYMPADYPTRGKYLTQFKDMATRIASLQGDDGLWTAGMLDPKYYGEPENSGSSFFCFAMAWGINEGILDRATFEPVVAKAWKGLLAHVHQDGRLDCIQQTGSGPAHYKTSSTYVYGVGAFLLAGQQVNKLALTEAAESRK